jgi:anaerobic selenocysteine-containing dehydrogenase
MRTRSTMRDRRRFLKKAGLAAGALLALGPGRRPAAAADAGATAGKSRKGRGYRPTAHIRSYYQKAGL